MNCTVEDCAKRRRSSRSPYCEMHYYRLRRSGTLYARPQHELTVCSVTGCGLPEKGSSYCAKHETRVRRHGSPDACTHQRDRALRRRDGHHGWTGDLCTYAAAHLRLKAWRGSARKKPCIDCGNPARQWSYNRSSQFELTENGTPYSPRPEDYDPRCVPCHKRFDLAAIKAAEQGWAISRKYPKDAA